MTDHSRDPAAIIGRKVMRRLVAPAAFFILMGSIDRTNVGFAALQMNESLGLSATQYGFGAGVLFVGYLLAKYPSVLLFEAIGMRRWLALITAAWGVASFAMAFVNAHWELYGLRMFIGFAEGGLSSGLMLYLSNWAPERYRASILAIPIVAISVAQVIGAPLSGWLLDRVWPGGVEAWRMMFVIEAIPALILAGFALLYFPDTPSKAAWLTDGERRWLAENVMGSAPESGPVDRTDRWAALRSPAGWTCGLVWYCILASNYGLMFWLPQIVKGLSGFGATATGLIVALPWAASAVGLILNARHSDRTGERFFHIAIPAFFGGVLLLSAYLLGPGLPGLLALILGGACTGCTVAAFWAIPPQLLRPGALAMGIVIINMVGSLAGATVPPLMGFLNEISGSFLPPTLLLFGIACICATLAMIARKQATSAMQGLTSTL